MNQNPVRALDTSAAIPLLITSHEAHDMVAAWATGRDLGLSGHAIVETYSVLTRLPGDARVSPADAVRLIDENFRWRLALPDKLATDCYRELGRRGVTGGACYDGLVALAAREHQAVLVTRDARAKATYEAVGVRVEIIGS